MIVATSVPVLGVSPSAGVTGAAVGGGGSRSVSVGGGGLGSGLGGVFGGGLGFGLTGAGFSCGGVGTASRATRLRSVGRRRRDQVHRVRPAASPSRSAPG